MKKVLTIANILVLVLTLASCFSGNYMILPLAIAYAMALGSMHGSQNKYFHYITIFLNSFYALGGVIAIGFVVLKKIESMQASELTIVIAMVSLLLLVIPLLNVNYTKSRISA